MTSADNINLSVVNLNKNSSTQLDGTNNGINGLGAINESVAGSTACIIGDSKQSEVDTEANKLKITITGTTADEQMRNFKEYLINTELFSILPSDNYFETNFGISNIFYTQRASSQVSADTRDVFCIFVIPDKQSLKDLITKLQKANRASNNVHRVAVCNFRYESPIWLDAKTVNLELFGLDDIDNVNLLVSRALSGMMSFGHINLGNKFAYSLAKDLSSKVLNKHGYSTDEAANIKSNVTTYGQDLFSGLKEAFIDGFGQIKSDITNITNNHLETNSQSISNNNSTFNDSKVDLEKK